MFSHYEPCRGQRQRKIANSDPLPYAYSTGNASPSSMAKINLCGGTSGRSQSPNSIRGNRGSCTQMPRPHCEWRMKMAEPSHGCHGARQSGSQAVIDTGLTLDGQAQFTYNLRMKTLQMRLSAAGPRIPIVPTLNKLLTALIRHRHCDIQPDSFELSCGRPVRACILPRGLVQRNTRSKERCFPRCWELMG